MKIEPKIFKQLYEIAYLEVVKNKFYNISAKGKKTDFSPLIWEIAEDGKPLSIYLFSGNRQQTTSDFLHRIYLKSKRAKKDFNIDDLTYFKMLGYIYQSEFKNEDLKKYNSAVLSKLESRFINDLDNGYFRDGKTLKNPTEQEEMIGAKDLILKFYSLLHQQDQLKKAWDLLTPKLQDERWSKNFNRFSIGYTNTKRIKNPHVFDFEVSPGSVDCKLFYEDVIANYDCGPLDAIHNLTIGQIEVFFSNVERLRSKVNLIGGQNFEEIKLSKLFDPAAAEFIWWFCELDPEKLNKIFPKKTSTVVYKLVKITCKFDETKKAWFIDWIEGTPAYSNQ